MAKTKAYPLGATDGQRLPDTKLNIIDTNAANSLDLSGGGAHTLGAALTLTGAVGGENLVFQNIDVFVSGTGVFSAVDAIITGNITGVDNLTASQTITTQDLAVTDDATFGDDVAIGGDAQVTGNGVFGGNILLTGNFTGGGSVTGGAFFGTTLSFTGNASIGGNITGVDDMTMSGALSIGGAITTVDSVDCVGEVLAGSYFSAGTYIEAGTFFVESVQVISSPVDEDTGATYNSVNLGFCHVTGTLSNTDTKSYIFRMPSISEVGARVTIRFDNTGPGGFDPGIQIVSNDGADVVWEPSGPLTTSTNERRALSFVRVLSGTGDFGSDWIWNDLGLQWQDW